MADSDLRITPSIVDRLVDYEPHESNESPKSVQQSINDLKLSVKRDVEWLLNTRIAHDQIPEGLEETKNSLAAYGLPDFVGMSTNDSEGRKLLMKNMEDTLRIFEPRLINLRVTIKEIDVVGRGVVFQIEADLKMEPVPEPVVFDTVLMVGSGDFEII
ncbi:MAG: type VI secretion system baseplate subunit TssE [Acidobacteria bacterium]|nr:MAG: type VI secretion system baseplate subunit TssE [Acidobacteriota bacterium]REJ98969.1 MAG: type VI secretion system baseplate subunit TssE [Acidobacteriota bacterium]REK16311.1 MAG: type VI secretion system baseplate subunit TssE [Acidobacteriota bacterium]REK43992.1 MAG: type VI secretion system baseplate subunit TssE [Acidobacteriota bacterium]